LRGATSILSIGLLALFLFGEGFDVRVIDGSEWIGLLFFPFGVVVGFLVAWKREALGSLISIGSLLCFYLAYGLMLSGRLPRGWAFAAFTSPAFFFLVSSLMERTIKNSQQRGIRGT
jgi:hypothetical protein